MNKYELAVVVSAKIEDWQEESRPVNILLPDLLLSVPLELLYSSLFPTFYYASSCLTHKYLMTFSMIRMLFSTS